ncbi:MAG: hypothetical protein AAB642_00965 [Patescibacteria group bacterium]
MPTVTLPKPQYDILEKKARLYESILRVLPERRWGIEVYSKKRVQEFLREDIIPKKIQERLKKLLRQLD